MIPEVFNEIPWYGAGGEQESLQIYFHNELHTKVFRTENTRRNASAKFFLQINALSIRTRQFLAFPVQQTAAAWQVPQ